MSPFWLPTKRRPPATAGCAHAEVDCGNPKAHFSVRFGTWLKSSPALSAVWNRRFSPPTPHPLQWGPSSGSTKAGVLWQRPALATVASAETERPVMNSATAWRCAFDKLRAWRAMTPSVSAATIASGERCPITSSVGARSTPGGVWHIAHCASNSAAPVGSCAPTWAVTQNTNISTNVTSRVFMCPPWGGRATARDRKNKGPLPDRNNLSVGSKRVKPEA